MLLGKYFLQDLAPWGESTSLSAKILQNGKDHLMQGRFLEANKSFSLIINQAEKYNHVVWAYLLRCYSHHLQANYGPKAEKKDWQNLSNIDYVGAGTLDRQLAFDEVAACSSAVILLPEILDLNPGLDFAALQRQIWHLYFADKYFREGNHDQALEHVNSGLKELPSNHFLLYIRAKTVICHCVVGLKDSTEAINDLTQAIQACESLPTQKARLSNYLINRSMMHYVQGQVEEMLQDFQQGIEHDDGKEGIANNNFRCAVLQQTINAYPILAIEDKEQARTIQKIKALTLRISKDKTRAELYLQRNQAYLELKEEGPAVLDKSIANWLVRCELDSSHVLQPNSMPVDQEPLASLGLTPESDEKELRTILNAGLVRIKDVKKELRTEKEKQKMEKALQTRERKEEEKMIGSILKAGLLRFNELKKEVQDENKKTAKLEKSMRAFVMGLIARTASILEEKAVQNQRNESKRNHWVKKQDKKNQRQFVGEILSVVVDKAYEQAISRQEKFIFKPVAKIVIPEKVAEFGRQLKALPGVLAKRSHLYGGTGRDGALGLNREGLDYDVGTALPLEVAAAVMQKVFSLTNLPKIEHDLIQCNFLHRSKNGEESVATLSVSHRAILADKSLSYTEAMRRDVYDYDFLQNAFIVAFPEQDLEAAVYYPLDWWSLYLPKDQASMPIQVYEANQNDYLSPIASSIASNSVFLTQEGDKLKATFMTCNPVLVYLPEAKAGLPIEFNLDAQSLKQLDTDPFGRVVITTESVPLIKNILDKIETNFFQQYGRPLNSMKANIVEIIAKFNVLETIRDVQLSFLQDSIRILRAIHQTTSLGFPGISLSMIQGMRENFYPRNFMNDIAPGKLNSWFHKIFCKDGKSQIVTNFGLILHTGLLQACFPSLAAVCGDSRYMAWLTQALKDAGAQKTLSLNYIYALFIVATADYTHEPVETVIAANRLFAFNFKEMLPGPYIDKARKSLMEYIIKMTPTQTTHITVNNFNLVQIFVAPQTASSPSANFFMATKTTASAAFEDGSTAPLCNDFALR